MLQSVATGNIVRMSPIPDVLVQQREEGILLEHDQIPLQNMTDEILQLRVRGVDAAHNEHYQFCLVHGNIGEFTEDIREKEAKHVHIVLTNSQIIQKARVQVSTDHLRLFSVCEPLVVLYFRSYLMILVLEPIYKLDD